MADDDNDDGDSELESNSAFECSGTPLDSSTILLGGIDNTNTPHAQSPCPDVNDVDTSSITINPYGIPSDTISGGIGTIHAPYGSIVSDFTRTVFKIGTPKDWQLLLIQAIVLNKNVNKLCAFCI